MNFFSKSYTPLYFSSVRAIEISEVITRAVMYCNNFIVNHGPMYSLSILIFHAIRQINLLGISVLREKEKEIMPGMTKTNGE